MGGNRMTTVADDTGQTVLPPAGLLQAPDRRVRLSSIEQDRQWYAAGPMALADPDDEVEAVIGDIERAVIAYPYASEHAGGSG